MPYIPPHLRTRRSAAPLPPPTSVDTSSDTLFPSLGNAPVTATAARTNFAGLSWKENVVPEPVADPPPPRPVFDEEGARRRGALMSAYLRPHQPPAEYIRNDDRYEAYLAEQDYLDAVKYDEENPLPEGVVDTWARQERVVAPKQQVMEDEWDESEPEMTEEELRERITFLQKRLRRNGTLREDREAYENELRELQRILRED